MEHVDRAAAAAASRGTIAILSPAMLTEAPNASRRRSRIVARQLLRKTQVLVSRVRKRTRAAAVFSSGAPTTAVPPEIETEVPLFAPPGG